MDFLSKSLQDIPSKATYLPPVNSEGGLHSLYMSNVKKAFLSHVMKRGAQIEAEALQEQKKNIR